MTAIFSPKRGYRVSYLELELREFWRPFPVDLKLDIFVSSLAFDGERARHPEVKERMRRPVRVRRLEQLYRVSRDISASEKYIPQGGCGDAFSLSAPVTQYEQYCQSISCSKQQTKKTHRCLRLNGLPYLPACHRRYTHLSRTNHICFPRRLRARILRPSSELVSFSAVISSSMTRLSNSPSLCPVPPRVYERCDRSQRYGDGMQGTLILIM